MREIKFRAWLKNEKKMVDVVDIGFKHKIIGYIEKTFYGDATFEDIVLLQFTGLYDKNGTPIYEGDIVRVKITQEEDLKLFDLYQKNIVGYVCYDEEYCLFYLKNCFVNFMNWTFNDEIEVIGNIFENKELL